jgi:hypothetical protein
VLNGATLYGLSADGRFVLFAFNADGGIVAEVTDRSTPALAVHDRDSDGNGAYDEPGQTRTVAVSFRPDGSLFPADERPLEAALSADGRVVTMIAPGSGSPQRVFVRDLTAGETVEISVLDDPQRSLGSDIEAGPDADGSHVIYSSVTTGAEVRVDLFRTHTCIGAAPDCMRSTELITRRAMDGGRLTEGAPPDGYQPPALSASGRYAAFSHFSRELSLAEQSLNQNAFDYDVFVWDSCLGGGKDCGPILQRLSGRLPDGAEAEIGAYSPALSADGRYVVFPSADPLLAGLDLPPFKVVLYIARTGFAADPSAPPGE